MSNNLKKLLSPAFLFSLALMIFSCRTLPEAPYPDTVQWLPQDSNLIIRFAVPGNHELAQLLASEAGLKEQVIDPLLKRSSLFTVGFELDGSKKKFDQIPVHLVALGNWPRGIMGSLLGKTWQRSSGERHRWDGPAGLEIAVPDYQEILLSRRELTAMQERKDHASALTGSRQRLPMDVDMGILIEEQKLVTSLLPVAAGRIDAITVGLQKSETSGYDVKLICYAGNQVFAKPLALALRIALAARFNSSKLPQERQLFKRVQVKVVKKSIQVTLPAMELVVLKKLVADLKLFEEEDA